MKTIAWLEDDAFFVQNIMRPLRDQGFEVKIYENAATMIADIHNVANACLVVVDLIVPPGSSEYEDRYGGISVLKTLSNLRTSPPVLVFSVVIRQNVLDVVNRYTPNVITKPVRLRDFSDLALRLIEKESSCHVG
jgi:DNA-binding NtrC family response regulator